jgi:hypothetical protein
MRRILKPVVAACAAVATALAWAIPADAAYPLVVSKRVDATFHVDEDQVTCTTLVGSSFRLGSDRKSYFQGGISMDDADTECDSTLFQIRVDVFAIKNGRVVASSSAQTYGDYVVTDGVWDGVADRVIARHHVHFDCDEEPTEGCLFSYSTSPK